MVVLQNAINKKKFKRNKRKFDRDVMCSDYEGLMITPHINGLLALHFMEFYTGLSYNPSLEGYEASVLEYLLTHVINTSEYAKSVLGR